MKPSLFLSAMVIFQVTFPSSAEGQWSGDTLQNTAVCSFSGEQTLPKTAVTSDGGCYISWFDNRSGDYAVYLQKFNVQGLPQLQEGGLLVSNHAQSSSLVDYDLAVDANDNAILVFTDMRNGDLNPFAYKIGPSGEFLWGADGMTLTDSTSYYQPNPKVVTTSDGGSVVLWIYASTPRKIAIQKYDAAGNPQWGNVPMRLSSGTTENYDWPSLVASDSGSVILLWSGYTGSFISPSNYKLYTQKFSGGGNRVWNATQDTVYSLGRVSGFYTPRIISDGIHGAVYCWRDDRNSDNLQSAFVQRFNAAGDEQFPANGAECSTLSGNNHFDPIASYDSESGTTYAFWMEANSGQTQSGGLYGQRLSGTGQRLWGESGTQFKPPNNNTFSGLAVFTHNNRVFVHFNEAQFGSANNLIKAFAADSSGAFSWSGSIQTPGSFLAEKIHLNSKLNPDGMSILAWADRRFDFGDIYAQNITFDGLYGNVVGVESPSAPDWFELISNYPNPFNPQTTIAFELPSRQHVRLTVYNMLGQEVRTLRNGYALQGRNSVIWDGRDAKGREAGSGVYLYRLETGKTSIAKKMILLK